MRTFIFALVINALAFLTSFFFATQVVKAHTPNTSFNYKPVLSDLNLLRSQNIPVTYASESEGIGFAYITPAMEAQLQKASHAIGRCGSFESLESERNFDINSAKQVFESLRMSRIQNENYLKMPFRANTVVWSEYVQKSIDQVDELELKNWITWISSFPTRFNKGAKANEPVQALYDKLENLIQIASFKTEISLISHSSTPMKTIRVRILGSEYPNEVLVLGAHYDSINGYAGSGPAPGADDNASGSANLLEALRILLAQNQPKRTIEFFWYAGEESGLLGSAEIAKQYKAEKKDVVAVLQLDMTLMPGEGELVIGNIEDFTSAWLRDYLVSMNDTYLKIKLIADKCGYGCSDHASWYRNGFPTLLPFEATTSTMNRNIHTAKDLIDNKSSFRHSAVFAKMALVFALDLGNSRFRQPFNSNPN